MATVMKPRRPVVTDMGPPAGPSEDNLTVEKYLEAKFEEMVKDFRNHASGLVAKLHKEYEEGVASINAMMPNPTTVQEVVVNLKCIAGAHLGQRFRLEASSDGDDVFKMGRSTGKLFKEKGVCLYKDKEISTTHAKIELRNGQAFVIDNRSTNGSQLNGEDLVGGTPYRLKEGDVITMGTTELLVSIAEASGANQENTFSNN